VPAADRRHLATRPAGAPGAGGGARDGSARAAGGKRVDRPAGFPQSLVYSGLLGLVISLTGLSMVMVRRRVW
jgi:hypothetical protein